MKKLIIMVSAAIVTLSGVTYAANCAPEAVPATPAVYKIKLTVNTPAANTPEAKPVIGSICVPGEENAPIAAVRTKGKTKLTGWIYDCACACDTVANGSVVMWDSKHKVAITDPALTSTFLHIIGKKQTQAEWLFELAGTAAYDSVRTVDYAFTCAGFGKYSPAKKRYTQFSGTFTGTASTVYDLSNKTGTSCDPAGYWLCGEDAIATDDAAIAYGKWSVKYSASASKKYSKGYLKLPKYASLGNEEAVDS